MDFSIIRHSVLQPFHYAFILALTGYRFLTDRETFLFLCHLISVQPIFIKLNSIPFSTTLGTVEQTNCSIYYSTSGICLNA